MIRAKEAVNEVTLAQSLAQIQRDCVCTKVDFKTPSPKCAMIAVYNNINNINFKKDCVHLRKYIKIFDMRAIVKVERPDVAPVVYFQIRCSQPTPTAVEPSFSMLGKLLSKDFFQQMWKGISLHFNKL